MALTFNFQMLSAEGGGTTLVDETGNPYQVQAVAFTPPPSVADLTQPTWFIDPVNGSDTNNGYTLATALKTRTALANKWRGGVLAPIIITVTVVGSLPASDVPNFDFTLSNSASGSTDLRFVTATPATTPIPGPYTVTVQNPTTRTVWKLGTGADATGLVTGGPGGQNIRILDSTQNAYIWGWKNSGDTVFFGDAFTFPGVGNQLGPFARFTPVNTDTFVLQTLIEMNNGTMRVSSERSKGNRPRISFQDFCLGTTTGGSGGTESFSIIADGTVDFFFYGCSFLKSIECQAAGRFFFFENCYFGGPGAGLNFILNCNASFDAGVLNNATSLSSPSASLTFDLNCILEACTMGLFGPVFRFGTCGMFDAVPFAPGLGAINIGLSGTVFEPINDTGTFVWGGGADGQNPGVGISVGAGVNLYASLMGTPNINLTGALGDFTLAGQTSSFHPAPGGGAASGPFANTWANFFNVADFNGVAYNPSLNSWIVSQ